MFKVMTWNVENLFRVGQPSGPTTPAVYDNKLHAVITTGRRWDPVIAAHGVEPRVAMPFAA